MNAATQHDREAVARIFEDVLRWGLALPRSATIVPGVFIAELERRGVILVLVTLWLTPPEARARHGASCGCFECLGNTTQGE